MANVPNIFVSGKMDSDTNYTLVDNKGYVYALNLRPSGYGEDGTMHAIKGSEKRADYSESKTMVVVGEYNGENNKLYTFLARKDGLSKIVETDIETKASRLIIEDAEFLKFDLLRWEDCEESERKYLLSVNQIDNFLVFSNEVWKDVRMIDIDRDYSSGFELEDIILAKKPPRFAPLITSPTIAPEDSHENENKRNKFVSFSYRYKYADGSYSPFSFYSDAAFREYLGEMEVNSKRENKSMANRYDSVKVVVNSGDSRVKGIEVIAREHGTQNGYIIYSATKGETEYNGVPIADNQLLEIKYNFSSNYTMVDAQLIDLIYSNYPKYPKTQDYIGSRLFFANYKEGFDLKDESGGNINIDIDYQLNSTNVNYDVNFGVSKKTAISMLPYKVGIVYYDDYNEATTVLANSNDTDNEVIVGFENRTKINKILAKINHNPPAFATKFKFVVQHQVLNYEVVYITYGKKVGKYTYLQLSGDNVNRVKKGDTLILIDDSQTEYNEVYVEDVNIYGSEVGVDKSYFYMKIIDSKNVINLIPNGTTNSKTYKLDVGVGGYEENVWGIDFEYGSSNTRRFDATSGYAGTQSAKGWQYASINNRGHLLKSDFGEIKEGDVIKIDLNFEYMWKKASGTYSTNSMGNINLSNELYASDNYQDIYEFLKSEYDQPLITLSEDGDRIWFSTNYLYPNHVKNSGIDAYGWEPNDGGSQGEEALAVKPTTRVYLIRGVDPIIFRTVNKENINTYYYESSNTFNVVNGVHVGAGAGGYFDMGFYNGYAWGNGVESYKIKDLFNGASNDKRFRANDINPNGYSVVHRTNDITYGGIYNSELKLNNLNVFNSREANWKTLPKEYGEIQMIVSTDGDITTFCNDKVMNVYYGKSIIADLQGNENVALTNDVLGGFQVLPYPFGCQNPESIIKTNEGIAFVDKKRTRYLLKAERQIAELNPDGSGHHYQGVKEIKEHQNFLASYNQAHGEYVFGLDHCKAIVFSPSKKGFSHYYNFSFDYIKGMNGKHFTSYKGIVYEDEVNDYVNNFAGGQNKEGVLKYVVNPEMGIDKIYKALKLHSNTAWNVNIKTNLTATQFSESAFTQKESYFFSEIYRDTETSQNSQGIGVIQSINGNDLEFGYNIGIDVAVSDTITKENGFNTSEITNIQGKVISVANSSSFSVGDYVLARKQTDGYYSPDGAVQRGKFMEVTLTNYGNEPYYITSAHTEIIKSNL